MRAAVARRLRSTFGNTCQKRGSATLIRDGAAADRGDRRRAQARRIEPFRARRAEAAERRRDAVIAIDVVDDAASSSRRSSPGRRRTAGRRAPCGRCGRAIPDTSRSSVVVGRNLDRQIANQNRPGIAEIPCAAGMARGARIGDIEARRSRCPGRRRNAGGPSRRARLAAARRAARRRGASRRATRRRARPSRDASTNW